MYFNEFPNMMISFTRYTGGHGISINFTLFTMHVLKVAFCIVTRNICGTKSSD